MLPEIEVIAVETGGKPRLGRVVTRSVLPPVALSRTMVRYRTHRTTTI